MSDRIEREDLWKIEDWFHIETADWHKFREEVEDRLAQGWKISDELYVLKGKPDVFHGVLLRVSPEENARRLKPKKQERPRGDGLRLSVADKIIAGAAVVAALVAIVAAVISYGQWRSLQDQVIDARETAKKLDRAWLTFVGISPDAPREITANTPIEITWQAANDGKLPAMKVRNMSTFRVVDVGPRGRPNFPEKGILSADIPGLGGYAVVGPNGRLLFSQAGTMGLDEPTAALIREKKKFLLMLGEGYYDSPGDEVRHSFGFCQWYDPADRTWSACDAHVWAD